MMKHSTETKERACQLYRDGMPPRGISETLGIPIRTIHRWTANEVSEELSFIHCVICGKKKRVTRLGRRYCSESCKSRARYRRKTLPALPKLCIECGEQFETRRTNREYCSKRCKNRAAKRRERQQ